MIDFQNKKLNQDVYELINKLYDLAPFSELPRFKTKQLKNGKWECILKIPGISPSSVANKDTEIESINKCASIMLHILRCQNKEGIYDPTIEDSIYKDNLESYFGEIDYDPNYYYYMSVIEKPDYQMDNHLVHLFRNKFNDLKEKYSDNADDDIVRANGVYVARLLIKRKKHNTY